MKAVSDNHRTSLTDHVTKVEVRNKTQHPFGRHEDLQTSEETEAEVVRTRLPTILPGKDHLARHCGGSKRKGKTKEAVGRQRQRVGRTGLSRDTERCGRQTEMEVAGCEIVG